MGKEAKGIVRKPEIKTTPYAYEFWILLTITILAFVLGSCDFPNLKGFYYGGIVSAVMTIICAGRYFGVVEMYIKKWIIIKYRRD